MRSETLSVKIRSARVADNLKKLSARRIFYRPRAEGHTLSAFTDCAYVLCVWSGYVSLKVLGQVEMWSGASAF